MRPGFYTLIFVVLAAGPLAASDWDGLVINELMVSNAAAFMDPDTNNFSDWLELYNAGEESIDLTGCSLSDEPSQARKWILTADHLTAKPGSSGIKTLVGETALWRFWPGRSEPTPGLEWTEIGYDAMHWQMGLSGFGYGDTARLNYIFDTMLNQFSSLYIRRTFSVTDPAVLGQLILSIYVDDAFVCFINGKRVAEFLAPEKLTYDALPPTDHESEPALTFNLGAAADLLVPGENVIAIVGFNIRLDSSDFVLAPSLYSAEAPTSALQPGQHILFWLDGLDEGRHANFKLDAQGETISLHDPQGNLLDSITYPPQQPDTAFARLPDGGEAWGYVPGGTPGEANGESGFLSPQTAPQPVFSSEGGFYANALKVTLSTALPDGEIYYSLDGSQPTRQSPRYTEPIAIAKTAVLRARLFSPSLLPSPVSTNTYFIGETFTLPVISLSTDPDFLWDDTIGIYVTGTNGIAGNCVSSPQNYNQDWERPVHVEYYESSQLGFKLDAGTKIFGGCSRTYPQKSLGIFARDKYGASEITYPLFKDKYIHSVKNFILRNGGNDWIRTLFSDAMMQYLTKDRMDLDYQAYQPAILFLNGEYRGIMNIREKLNEHYPAQNYDIDPDEVDLLERNQVIMAGDAEHFKTTLAYVTSQNKNDPAVYAAIQARIDTDELINYLITKIYYSSNDWPQNNIKYWRPRTPEGRWRWMTYDNDSSFGIWWSVNENTLDRVSRAGDWSTQLFAALFQSNAFRDEFIQRYAAHINTTFAPERVYTQIQAMQERIAPEMPRQIERWGPSNASGWGYSIYRSMRDWTNEIERMRAFARQRPSIARSHVLSRFRLSGTFTLSTATEPEGAGCVLIHDVALPEEVSEGLYFKDVPLRIVARARAGYRFVEWQGSHTGNVAQFSFTSSSDRDLIAIFEKTEPVNLVINEIHYNSSSSQGPDAQWEFIEIANAGNLAVDLSGYQLRNGAQFVFPQGAMIEPGKFVVIAKNAATYEGQGYPVYPWTWGNLGNGGEELLLTDPLGTEIDRVAYLDEAPFPSRPDGDGPSLALGSPLWDNALPENWRSSSERGGTPGAANFPQTPVADWALYQTE